MIASGEGVFKMGRFNMSVHNQNLTSFGFATTGIVIAMVASILSSLILVEISLPFIAIATAMRMRTRRKRDGGSHAAEMIGP